MKLKVKWILRDILFIVVCLVIVAALSVGSSIVVVRAWHQNVEPDVVKEIVMVEPEPIDEVQELNQRPTRGVIEVTEIPDVEAYEVPDDFSPIDCRLDEEIQRYTYSMAQAYNIDFEFLMAVMFNESAFNPDCISPTNDYGLMQINKCNHKWLSEELGITDYLDPYQSILAGTYIFSGLFEKYGDDTNKVLMSYNMGDDSARRLWNQGIYESNYSRKISQTMAEYKERVSDEG